MRPQARQTRWTWFSPPQRRQTDGLAATLQDVDQPAPGELFLLLGGHSGDAAAADLAAVGDESVQQVDVPVVDVGHAL